MSKKEKKYLNNGYAGDGNGPERNYQNDYYPNQTTTKIDNADQYVIDGNTDIKRINRLIDFLIDENGHKFF